MILLADSEGSDQEQADLGLCCPHTPEDQFSHGMASITALGPVVQSIVSLTSLFVVKMLTVPISIYTISNSQVFLLKKM